MAVEGRNDCFESAISYVKSKEKNGVQGILGGS